MTNHTTTDSIQAALFRDALNPGATTADPVTNDWSDIEREALASESGVSILTTDEVATSRLDNLTGSIDRTEELTSHFLGASEYLERELWNLAD